MYHTRKMDPNLYKAAMLSNIEVLRQHKDQLGVQLTANNNTVLHVAAQFQDKVECVEEILNLQPSLLCRVNSERETALHIAARNGHSNTVRVLIQHKNSLKVVFNIFPNFFSSYLVRRLSWTGVQITKKRNKHKDTALHEAVRNNHLEVVEMLVREDAVFPHVVNNFGETPLYIAAKKVSHSHAIVSTILDVCKSPAHSGPDATTALHATVIAGCPECTEKILEKKPNLLNEADLDGWTPLHYAAREGHTDIMKVLLSHSLDCWEIVNGKGQNILHIAKEYEKEGVINFIRSWSVENSNVENQMDIEGNTPFNLPLTRDVKNSWLSNLENQMDNDGNTPFHLSATSNEGSKPKEFEISQRTKTKEDRQMGQNDYNSIRGTYLVVAALIGTVTFTAGLTLPGGYHSNGGRDQGRALLVKVAAFKVFVIANSIAMAISLSAIYAFILSSLTKKPREIEQQFRLGHTLVIYAMFAMIIAFMSGSYAALANSLQLRVLVVAYVSVYFIIFVHSSSALARDASITLVSWQYRQWHSVFRKRRSG